MSSLYHPKFYSYTNDARTINDQAEAMAKRIFEEWMDAGYSPREISQVIQNAVQMQEAHVCLEHSAKIHKAERKRKDGQNNTT